MAYNVGRILPDSTPGCVTWRVENFFSYPQDVDGHFIASPPFSALDAAWRLVVYPSDYIAGASRTRLHLMKSQPYPRMPSIARFQFGMRGREGAELIACSGQTEIQGAASVLGETLLPVHWRQDWKEFAPGGVLSVFCYLREREVIRGKDTSTQTEDIGQVSATCVDGPSKSYNLPGPLKVLENLKELLSNEEACDVTLKVQNQEFKAHKALLVARSPVFRAMFCHEMSEKLSNEVHITDCDPDAFRIFLSHVYTGDAEGLSVSNAFDVFSVAEKYDATELKIQCKDCIACNITVENVCEVVAFSLLHDDSVLLEMASEFFTKHFRLILLTNKWQRFLREHATAANELLIRASNFHVRPE